MADASWLPDPTGAHELRYWNGMTWTERASDQGTANVDPLSTELPPQHREPCGVLDILLPLISEARHKKTIERQSQ